MTPSLNDIAPEQAPERLSVARVAEEQIQALWEELPQIDYVAEVLEAQQPQKIARGFSKYTNVLHHGGSVEAGHLVARERNNDGNDSPDADEARRRILTIEDTSRGSNEQFSLAA